MTTTINQLAPDDYDRCTGNTDTCPDMECLACGERECQHSEPMHFHHDGCPLCAEMDDQQEGTSTPWAGAITRLRLRIENAARINDGAELFDDLRPRVRGAR